MLTDRRLPQQCVHDILIPQNRTHSCFEGLGNKRTHRIGQQSADIAALRALHIEMDQAVALAYGWPIIVNCRVVYPDPLPGPRASLSAPLDLGHGFHQTKQGIRYTISESARRTVLDRLLALNQQRYEEEVKAGLHNKRAKKGNLAKFSWALPAQGRLSSSPQLDLFA